MNLIELGASAWRPSILVISLVAATYATPLLHIVLRPLGLRSRFAVKACKLSGISEVFVAPVRDTLGLAILTLTAAWYIIDLATSKTFSLIFPAMVAIALIASSLYHRFIKTRSLLSLCEFMAQNPLVHPQEFFDYVFCCYGFLRIKLPDVARSVIDPANLNFRTEKDPSKIGKVQKLKGIWTTMRIASLTALVRKKLGYSALMNMSGAFATVWAARMAQLICASVKVDGVDADKFRPARRIYAFTHKSFFDFIFAPLVPVIIALNERSSACKPLPAFLLAANHFQNNFIFTRVFGIGRAAQNFNMLFVERRGSKKTARDATIKAAKKLVEENSDLAIFPQGTRARPYFEFNGIRTDAGYYTVGSAVRVGDNDKHLKRGIAYIAAESAIMLGNNSKWRIEVVPVAISGTANACPRKSSIIHKNVSIKLCVGEPIEICAENSAPIYDTNMPVDSSKYAFVEILMRRIDSSLLAASKLHAELERRFFKDVRSLCDALKFDEVAIAMKSWRGDDALVHAILDIIYTCPIKEQRKLVGELIFLLLNFAERDDIVAFRKKAARLLPQ